MRSLTPLCLSIITVPVPESNASTQIFPKPQVDPGLTSQLDGLGLGHNPPTGLPLRTWKADGVTTLPISQSLLTFPEISTGPISPLLATAAFIAQAFQQEITHRIGDGKLAIKAFRKVKAPQFHNQGNH